MEDKNNEGGGFGMRSASGGISKVATFRPIDPGIKDKPSTAVVCPEHHYVGIGRVSVKGRGMTEEQASADLRSKMRYLCDANPDTPRCVGTCTLDRCCDRSFILAATMECHRSLVSIWWVIIYGIANIFRRIIGIIPIPIYGYVCTYAGLLSCGCECKDCSTVPPCIGPGCLPSTCCCCAQKLCFQSVTPFNNGAHFGHNIDTLIEMLFRPGTSGTCDCEFEWWERTNVPYGCVPTAGVWTNTRLTCPSSFTSWNNRVIPCPQGGLLSIVDHDSPALAIRPGRTTTRVLEFKIILKSCPNCACANASLTITGQQTLSIINGVPQGQGAFATTDMC